MIFIPITAVTIGFFAISALVLWLDFKREERKHVDASILSDRLEAELKKVKELKEKIDSIGLRVGLR